MADRESWIKRLKLPADQLANLAAQVNRICGLEPGDFQPEVHLPDVRDVIRHLDPHLSVKGRFHLKFIDEGDDPSRSVRGFRALSSAGGLFSYSEKKKGPHEVAQLGKRDGVGIGSYIAEKVREKRGVLTLSFTPFMDYDLASMDPESARPYRRIMYQTDTLEPSRITKEEPRVRYGFFVTYRSFPIWSK